MSRRKCWIAFWLKWISLVSRWIVKRTKRTTNAITWNNWMNLLRGSKAIWDIFHIKKEVLYVDTRSVFESYKASNPQTPGMCPQSSLQLADADKAELLKANLFYTGDQSQNPIPIKFKHLSGRWFQMSTPIWKVLRNLAGLTASARTHRMKISRTILKVYRSGVQGVNVYHL